MVNESTYHERMKHFKEDALNLTETNENVIRHTIFPGKSK